MGCGSTPGYPSPGTTSTKDFRLVDELARHECRSSVTRRPDLPHPTFITTGGDEAFVATWSLLRHDRAWATEEWRISPEGYPDSAVSMVVLA